MMARLWQLYLKPADLMWHMAHGLRGRSLPWKRWTKVQVHALKFCVFLWAIAPFYVPVAAVSWYLGAHLTIGWH